ncbi:MAG: tRNA epoxyqueuosine(34) reductase QueG [Pirellulales bacterium]|nr:tRNA epoxyqueuosine(34) reductase QueG [Pirellulales bacterium]
MNAVELTAALKNESLRLGFDLAGAAPAVVDREQVERLDRWIADGRAADMDYFARRRDAYRDPSKVLDGAKSVLMLAMNYRTAEPAAPSPGQARVARYAWGEDYHEVIRRRLDGLIEFHNRLAPDARARGVVDTAPLLEKHFARLAGLGWIGKNTTLINRQFGSWLFLAGMLTTAELEYDQPMQTDLCGSCRACLDACPTGALTGPGRLDARRCISYLTIESRGAIPKEYQAAIGDRLFGCDACQQSCPWNRATPSTAEPAFQPRPGMNPVDLAELQSLDEEAFRERFRHTSLWRAGLDGLRRNAAFVGQNQKSIR